MPGLRGGKVRLESRPDGELAARFGKHELALKRFLTRPQSGGRQKAGQQTCYPADQR